LFEGNNQVYGGFEKMKQYKLPGWAWRIIDFIGKLLEDNTFVKMIWILFLVIFITTILVYLGWA